MSSCRTSFTLIFWRGGAEGGFVLGRSEERILQFIVSGIGSSNMFYITLWRDESGILPTVDRYLPTVILLAWCTPPIPKLCRTCSKSIACVLTIFSNSSITNAIAIMLDTMLAKAGDPNGSLLLGLGALPTSLGRSPRCAVEKL